jgi:glyoxylate reductase/D-3-phosphoglycerate dehydrogenase
MTGNTDTAANPARRPRVVLMPRLTPAVLELAEQATPDDLDVVVADVRRDEEHALGAIAEADFIMALAGAVTHSVLEAARGRIRLIHLLSAGYDEMDVPLAQEYGIPVATNGGANAPSVAEHIILMILASYRNLVAIAGEVRRGAWQSPFSSTRRSYEIDGKTIGLVGVGTIGRALAERLQGFGANLVYHDIVRLDAETEAALGLTFWDLPDLISGSDVISLHVPLLPETRHLIGAAELNSMKPTALLVNTARGEVIDEEALARALTEKRILGAALDVLSQEPPDPDNPLLALENCLVTSHIAGPTFDSWPRRFRNGFANIDRVVSGLDPQWLVP